MLKLTKKADYGLIALRHLATAPNAAASTREIADNYHLPVTLLAKWKTTLQLTALAMELVVAAWGAFPFLPQETPAFQGAFTFAAHSLFWLATIVTLVTGAQYWEQTRKALSPPPSR